VDRLRGKPLRYDAAGVKRRLDDTALAGLVYSAPAPVLGQLPGVIASARRGQVTPLLEIAKHALISSGRQAGGPPPGFSLAQGIAIGCNDYPTLWDRTASLRQRKRQFGRALRQLPDRPFAPFTAESWSAAIFDRGDNSIRWPNRAGSGQPTNGAFPEVPVLVVSGELETNTPSAEGRAVARKFANARFVEVPNSGHVPEADEPCAAKIEIAFLRACGLTTPAACGRSSRYRSRQRADGGRPSACLGWRSAQIHVSTERRW
jgi:pimeloyl-ACP methyl ester carboxylesterase